MTLSLELRRFALFLAASCGAAVNIVSRIAFNTVVSCEIAIIPAYLIGMTTAYFSFGGWTR